MHSNKLLSVMYAIMSELITFIIHSTLEIKIYINMIRNWIFGILCHVQYIIKVIWSLIAIIMFEFYIKLCILVYSPQKVIVIPTFQCIFDHSLTPDPPINNHSLSYQRPLNIHSISYHCSLTDPSTRHHKTELTTACFQHIGYIYQSLLRANLMFRLGVIISYLQYILEFVNNSDTIFTVSHKKSDKHVIRMMSYYRNIYPVTQPAIDDMELIQLMNLVLPIIESDTNDLLTFNFEFIIIISYDLAPLDLKAMRIDMYDRMGYNMDQIKVGVVVYGTFNRMAFVIDNFFEILTLTLFLNAFAIIFDGINVDSDKTREFNHINFNHKSAWFYNCKILLPLCSVLSLLHAVCIGIIYFSISYNKYNIKYNLFSIVIRSCIFIGLPQIGFICSFYKLRFESKLEYFFTVKKVTYYTIIIMFGFILFNILQILRYMKFIDNRCDIMGSWLIGHGLMTMFAVWILQAKWLINNLLLYYMMHNLNQNGKLYENGKMYTNVRKSKTIFTI